MIKTQSDGQAAWKKRFHYQKIGWARVARGNPTRAVVLSNQWTNHLQAAALDLDSGRLVQLTNKDSNLPFIEIEFSPDGLYFYFLNDHKGNEIGHLYRVPYAGGDAVDVTPDLPPYSLRGIGFSLDGQRLGLVAVLPEGYHLYVVDLAADGTFSRPRLIYKDKKEFWLAPLSANGRFTAVISTRKTNSRLYSIVVFDADSGEEVGELWDGPGQSVELGQFSPRLDSCRLVGVSTISGQKRPFIWNPITKERTDYDLPHLDGEILVWDWSADGSQLLLCQSHQAAFHLHTFDLNSQKLTRLNHPPGVYGFLIGPFGSPAQFLPNGNIVTLFQSATTPLQLIELDGTTGANVRSLFGPQAAVPGRPWQSITFPSSDKTPVQGWLMVPEGPGPFPLILNLHGGPHIVKNADFDPSAQFWIDQGVAYCSINYRGSTGFGTAFKSKIWGKIGHWELEDMVAARRYLIENNMAQPDAIFLNGASYGGYLTLWGLARKPDLWAGGLAWIAIADWVTAYEDAADAMKGAFAIWHDGTLADVPERYHDCSPTTYADQIKAPLLIHQGHNDTRTPRGQMELFVAKMKKRGADIKLVWFDIGHMGINTENAIKIHENELSLVKKVLSR